jgi:SAM-dependent methyltransferase
MNFHPPDNSSATANIIVPWLIERYKPRAVVDFGCNVGWWLKAFVDNGVTDVLGIDGDNMIPEFCLSLHDFVVADLTKPLNLGREFDLALCLEVGEHLLPESAETLVRSLTRHVDLVFWSAAPPGQGGYNHVNEQPGEYWEELFKKQGFQGTRLTDVLPPVPHVYYANNAYEFRRMT